jgi:hypothetical protein
MMNRPVAELMPDLRNPPTASPRQLVVDKIGAEFRPQTHAALGPWCFAGAEDVFPHWDGIAFVTPFETAAERCAQSEAVRRLSAALLDEVYPAMNARHGTNYDRVFWHLILANWLIHLTMLSWRLWRHVELFAVMSGDEAFDVSVRPRADCMQYADTQSFVNACYWDEEFRSWIISETIRAIAPRSWRLHDGKALADPPAASTAPRPRRHRRLGYINGVKWWQRLLLTGIINLRAPAPARFGPLVAADRANFPAAYLEFLSRLARATIPFSLERDFPALDAEARRQTFRRGRIHALMANPLDDQENVVLAHAIAAGERIVDVQHGGVYGTAALAPCGPDLEYCHDTFITWGWTRHENYQGRFLPLPSPLLSAFAKETQRQPKDLIFVGTMILGFNPRIDYCAEALEYRQWKRRFLQGLGGNAHAEFRYRPYASRFSIADADWLRRAFPQLRLAEGNLQQALSSCRMVVLDYPGTTLAEVLAANIPTICFWNKQQWLLSSHALPLFDRLEQAGILFGSPEAAADQVNRVLPDVETWWHNPERQRARAEWCHMFARADRSWLWAWTRAFWRL